MCWLRAALPSPWLAEIEGLGLDVLEVCEVTRTRIARIR
jgi:hypothetical protein